MSAGIKLTGLLVAGVLCLPDCESGRYADVASHTQSEKTGTPTSPALWDARPGPSGSAGCHPGRCTASKLSGWTAHDRRPELHLG